MSPYGARSAENRDFLDGILQHDVIVATQGATISVDQTVAQGIPCMGLNFLLPRECQSNGVKTIPVLVPNACLGTTILGHTDIFYALIEEIIVWLAGLGPKHTLIRVYHNNHNQRLLQSFSGEQPHNGFESFINSLRHSQGHSPSLGQTSGALGVMEVAQARTSSHQVSADFIVALTLNNRQRISLFLPRSVGQLPFDWVLDWLEVQYRFAS